MHTCVCMCFDVSNLSVYNFVCLCLVQCIRVILSMLVAHIVSEYSIFFLMEYNISIYVRLNILAKTICTYVYSAY